MSRVTPWTRVQARVQTRIIIQRQAWFWVASSRIWVKRRTRVPLFCSQLTIPVDWSQKQRPTFSTNFWKANISMLTYRKDPLMIRILMRMNLRDQWVKRAVEHLLISTNLKKKKPHCTYPTSTFERTNLWPSEVFLLKVKVLPLPTNIHKRKMEIFKVWRKCQASLNSIKQSWIQRTQKWGVPLNTVTQSPRDRPRAILNKNN